MTRSENCGGDVSAGRSRWVTLQPFKQGNMKWIITNKVFLWSVFFYLYSTHGSGCGRGRSALIWCYGRLIHELSWRMNSTCYHRHWNVYCSEFTHSEHPNGRTHDCFLDNNNSMIEIKHWWISRLVQTEELKSISERQNIQIIATYEYISTPEKLSFMSPPSTLFLCVGWSHTLNDWYFHRGHCGQRECEKKKKKRLKREKKHSVWAPGCCPFSSRRQRQLDLISRVGDGGNKSKTQTLRKVRGKAIRSAGYFVNQEAVMCSGLSRRSEVLSLDCLWVGRASFNQLSGLANDWMLCFHFVKLFFFFFH